MRVKFTTESIPSVPHRPSGPVLSVSGTKPELEPRGLTPGHTV